MDKPNLRSDSGHRWAGRCDRGRTLSRTSGSEAGWRKMASCVGSGLEIEKGLHSGLAFDPGSKAQDQTRAHCKTVPEFYFQQSKLNHHALAVCSLSR